MRNVAYQISKTNQSTFSLTVTKKRFIASDEILTEHFHIPFLDLLYFVKDNNIHVLFLESILKDFDLETIKKKVEDLSSFLFVFMYYINSNSKKRREELGHKYSFPDYNSNSKPNFRDYLKYLGHYYNECEIIISISNQVVKSTTKENRLEKEKEIYNLVVDECELILQELFNRFNGSEFYKDCLERGKEKQIEKQIGLIKEKNTESYPRWITKILQQNPELNKPNIINLSGVTLIKYLFRYPLLYRVYRSLGWDIFNFEKGNLFYPSTGTNDSRSNFHFIFLKLGSQIIKSYENQYYLHVKYCYPYYISDVLDINIPFVKQVNLNTKSKREGQEIHLELKNFEDKKDLNEEIEYVPILNDDRIPCLIGMELFYKYEIDNKLIYDKNEIINEISNKINILKDTTIEVLQHQYINNFLNYEYTKSDFKTELEKVRHTNSIILKNFHHQKIQFYFYHQLFHQYQKDIFSNSVSYQFFIPNTKEQDNIEVGRRTEWLVNRFLKNYIEYDRWFYTIDEEQENKITGYLNYPYETIPVCETIWNNQSVESYKPYDFSIIFRNIEYKIEVKSTRGDEENVFYISVKELVELLKNPDQYFILRLSYIQKLNMCFGIQFNDEFYGRFYKMKPETIQLVTKMLPEWIEYYRTNTLRFTVDQFDLIQDDYDEYSNPNFYLEPSVMNSRYWDKYEEFIQRNYFNNLERILESYSDFPEVSKLKEDLKDLKKDDRFHFVENLSNEEFVISDEVEDITVNRAGLNNYPFENNLPF